MSRPLILWTLVAALVSVRVFDLVILKRFLDAPPRVLGWLVLFSARMTRRPEPVGRVGELGSRHAA